MKYLSLYELRKIMLNNKNLKILSEDIKKKTSANEHHPGTPESLEKTDKS